MEDLIKNLMKLVIVTNLINTKVTNMEFQNLNTSINNYFKNVLLLHILIPNKYYFVVF